MAGPCTRPDDDVFFAHAPYCVSLYGASCLHLVVYGTISCALRFDTFKLFSLSLASTSPFFLYSLILDLASAFLVNCTPDVVMCYQHVVTPTTDQYFNEHGVDCMLSDFKLIYFVWK